MCHASCALRPPPQHPAEEGRRAKPRNPKHYKTLLAPGEIATAWDHPRNTSNTAASRGARWEDINAGEDNESTAPFDSCCCLSSCTADYYVMVVFPKRPCFPKTTPPTPHVPWQVSSLGRRCPPPSISLVLLLLCPNVFPPSSVPSVFSDIPLSAAVFLSLPPMCTSSSDLPPHVLLSSCFKLWSALPNDLPSHLVFSNTRVSYRLSKLPRDLPLPR